MRQRWTIILLLIAASVLAACGGDDSKTDTPLPGPRPLLESAAAQIQAASTFGLEIDVDGYPVTIDVGDLGTFSNLSLGVSYANGVFQAPDRLRADVDITVQTLTAQVQLIAIDYDHYLRSDIITLGRWINAELIPGFSPASLQAPEGGIAQALNSVTELSMVDQTDLDGLGVYHLSGQVEAEKINSLTFGLIRTQSGLLGIDVYILTDSKLIERVVLHEPAPEGADPGETTWTITFKDYNADITITAPEN